MGTFKNYCHICNQCPPICLIGKFCAKLEFLNLESKMSHLGVLESNFEKPLSFCNQRSRIFLIIKFDAETKILKFETKNAEFGCSWTEIKKYY